MVPFPTSRGELTRQFPELLREALRESGLTMHKLAQRSGFSEANLRRKLKDGGLTWPKITLIARQLPSTDLARMVEKCSTGAVGPAAVETPDFKLRFPKLLRESRTKTGITIRALARRSGIDATYLSRMERGLVPPPAAAKLGAIVSQLPSSDLSKAVGDRENEKIKLALTESTEALVKLIGEALPMAVLADRAWLESIKRRLMLCVAVIEVSEQKATSSKPEH